MTEQHLIIDWVNFLVPGIFSAWDAVEGTGLKVERFIPMKAYSPMHRRMVMTDFYGTDVDDFRGSQDFTIYIVTDPSPVYDIRPTTKGDRLVNTKMFDLKQVLREMTVSCGIHTTDNIQETKDNLRALGLYHHYKRRTFKKLKHVFDALKDVNYVVLRNFEDFPKITGDVDILTADYYAVKRIIDGDNPFHPTLEDGGYRVHNYVNIGGREVGFDIRCVGDNYYCEDFEKRILREKVRRKNFWVPDKDTHRMALLYHQLIHKGSSIGAIEFFGGSRIMMGKILFAKLGPWMEQKGFEYVEPNDKSVGYHKEENNG